MKLTRIKYYILVFIFSGCSSVSSTIEQNGAHLSTPEPTVAETIPEPITTLPAPPAPPQEAEQALLFSVVVIDIPIKDVLFVLARDAKINMDVHPELEGKITINAIDQTIEQILHRISLQADIRYAINSGLVSVMPDTPYMKSYDIDYPNMARSSRSNVSIATEVATTGAGADSDSAGGAGDGNISSTSISNVSNNDFWNRLIANIAALLRGGDSLAKLNDTNDDASNDTLSIIANPEAGSIDIRANNKQHGEIQHYIDNTMERALRQVLIEATIVEVTLNDEFQAGVDWNKVATDGEGFSFSQNLLGANLANSPVFELGYSNNINDVLDISSAVRMLSLFGNTKVLSSPRLMVLNNQTALLKVVDNRVYFTTTVETDRPDNGPIIRTFETEINTVPVGFVMSVTPQISREERVTLNARPTISRILGFVKDPNPAIQEAGIQNLIPEIQVREMESILKIQSGNIGIIGGLMQDSIESNTQGVPTLSKIPGLGKLFSYEADKSKKSELVIFIRPVVVQEASLKKDLKQYSRYIN